MNDSIILLYLDNSYLNINIYNLNLNLMKIVIEIINISYNRNSVFFKVIHLYDDTIAIILFSQSNYNSLEIKIGYIHNNEEF